MVNVDTGDEIVGEFADGDQHQFAGFVMEEDGEVRIMEDEDDDWEGEGEGGEEECLEEEEEEEDEEEEKEEEEKKY